LENYQSNILFLYYEHTKKFYWILFLILPSIVIILFLLQMPIEQAHEYQGIYHCDEKCVLHTMLPLDEVNFFTKNTQIVFDNELYSLNVLKFGEISNLENSFHSVQNLDILIPKNIYFENQVVTFKVLLKKESLFQVFIKFMKGGDEF